MQYYDEPEEYREVLKYINMGFTIMFTIECILKLLGFGGVRTSREPILTHKAWDILVYIYHSLFFLQSFYQFTFLKSIFAKEYFIFLILEINFFKRKKYDKYRILTISKYSGIHTTSEIYLNCFNKLRVSVCMDMAITHMKSYFF